MKTLLVILYFTLTNLAFGEFVRPPNFGNFQQLDQIQDVSGVNFCIYRRNFQGSQEPQYCINGNEGKHDLRGKVNVFELYVDEKQIVSGDAIYDQVGRKIIDLKTGQWVGDPTDLIGSPGQKGDKGEKGESCFYDNQSRLIKCGLGTYFSIDELKGEKGDQGPRGFPGAKGDTGDRGPIGITGLKGDKGDLGETGTFGVCNRISTKDSYSEKAFFQTVRAPCPSNTMLTGGGCSTTVLGNNSIRNFTPKDNSFYCSYNLDPAYTGWIEAYAICCES